MKSKRRIIFVEQSITSNLLLYIHVQADTLSMLKKEVYLWCRGAGISLIRPVSRPLSQANSSINGYKR